MAAKSPKDNVDLDFQFWANLKYSGCGFDNQADWEDFQMRFSASTSGPGTPLRPGLRVSQIGHLESPGPLAVAAVAFAVQDEATLRETEFCILIIVPPPSPDDPHEGSGKQLPVFTATKTDEARDTFESELTHGSRLFQLVPGEDADTPGFEPFQPEPPRVDWGLVKEDVKDVPVFALSDVERFRSLTNQVHEVTINGRAYVYKLARDPEFVREISMLRKLEALSRKGHTTLRAPKLEGVIGLDTIFDGILMTCIPSSRSLDRLILGDCEMSLADRQKWYDQVSEAVQTLHQEGLCWGDVKAAYVVIDGEGDAWLIDFEGGASWGWIDKQLKDTMAGDLQGLSRLHQVLGLGAS
ncbi:hypothetical protein BO82DRAFT_401721 [Aspergillus uvarum CBS 121591]|uniref:Protein kinase domain-containing protein n=1 Tax=Aspergillus uvarum CBS 121591 TaxID=1448315 RepID=A0A319CA25_9EURO|nr:hypothetical protein BO82DRAFT_401721 [Aspergillus uvarum CBS 121591]PYH82084.1 hypothetical protein BO82DRAFT_401721 [Aspergillus uvarum CBS 121591]